MNETNFLQIKLQSENYYSSWQYINLIIGIISLISCLISILTYIIFKSIRTFIMEIVLYLTICCFFQTLSYIIYFPDKESKSEDKICQFQASNMLFSGLSQFFWTCLLSFSIYQSVINLKVYSRKDQNTNLKITRIVYIFIGFGIPLIIALFGLILNIYGKAGFWCFIDGEALVKNNDNKYKIFYIFIFTILWICILFNLALYSRVIIYIKKSFDEEIEGKNRYKEYTRPLIAYSVIQILWLLPATTNRFYQIFDYSSIEILDFLQSLCDVSQGFFYSLVFGFTPSVRKAISNVFKKRKRTYSGNSKYSYDSLMRSNLDFSRYSYLD
jgi:hypothetical protein